VSKVSNVKIVCDVVPMGWLRSVGSFKLYVSFAEYRLFYRALLQTRLMILRSLLIEATPYPCPYPECSASKVRVKTET